MRIQFLSFFLTGALLACGQEEELLHRAGKSMANGATASEVLSNVRYERLHSRTEFRTLIRTHAAPGPVTMVGEKEPGEGIRVTGRVQDAAHQVLANVLVYVYQTDARGWYGSDRVHFEEMQGDRNHARLFAYVRTDSLGQFEVNTIQPVGYPQSDLPAHIHLEIFDKGKALLISELLFDDDERLQGERRTRSMQEGFLIARPQKEKGQKHYHYNIITR